MKKTFTLSLVLLCPLVLTAQMRFYIQPVITAGITEGRWADPPPSVILFGGTMLKGGINIGYTPGRKA